MCGSATAWQWLICQRQTPRIIVDASDESDPPRTRTNLSPVARFQVCMTFYSVSRSHTRWYNSVSRWLVRGIETYDPASTSTTLYTPYMLTSDTDQDLGKEENRKNTAYPGTRDWLRLLKQHQRRKVVFVIV